MYTIFKIKKTYRNNVLYSERLSRLGDFRNASLIGNE